MHPRITLLLAATLTLALGRLAAPSLRAEAAAPTGPTFRAMSYNIHHGEGMDKKIDLERIAALIKREGADLVGLQEVDKGVQRTAKRDLAAELAALTGMTPIFSNNHAYQGGEYGNAILSRFPVKSWSNTHYKTNDPQEQRGLLRVTVDVHGRELAFLCTHLEHRANDAVRWASLPQIDAVVDALKPTPALIVGDFNATPDSRVYARLLEKFDDTWALVGKGEGLTIPSDKPRKRIDYLWIPKDKSLVPLRIWVPATQASDHLPVVAEYRWAK